MISWLEIGDLHLNENDSLGRYCKDTGMNTRFKYKIDKLKSILVNEVENNNLDFVVFLGDIYNSINPSDLLRTQFNTILSYLLKVVGRVVIIPGNHETTGKLSAFEPDKLLAEGIKDGVLVASSEPQIMTIKNKKFALIPWGKTNYLERIDDKVKKDMVVFGHFTIDGADMGSKKANKNIGEVVSREEIKKYKQVSLGHIHKPQDYYNGSFFKNTFGERLYSTPYYIRSWYDKKIDSECKYVNDIHMYQIVVNNDGWFINNNKMTDLNDDVFVKSMVKVRYEGDKEFLKSFNLIECRKDLVERLDPFSLKLEKKLVDFGDNVNVGSKGEVMEFKDILKELTSDEKLIDYVVGVVNEN